MAATTRLPQPGELNWGDVLNAYLSVSTNEYGGLYTFIDEAARDAYFDGSDQYKTLTDGKVCIISGDKKIQKYDEVGTSWNNIFDSESVNSGSGAPGGNGTTPGQTYYDIDNSKLYIWDGTEWVEFSANVSGGFEEISSATYTGTELTSLIADGTSYGMTYESGKLKTVNDGTSTWTINYSGDEITTVTKS